MTTTTTTPTDPTFGTWLMAGGAAHYYLVGRAICGHPGEPTGAVPQQTNGNPQNVTSDYCGKCLRRNGLRW